jgi:DNA-binding response OmpR family regulator
MGTPINEEAVLQAAIDEAAAAHNIAAGAVRAPAGRFRVGALLDAAAVVVDAAGERAFGPFTLVVADAVLRRGDGDVLRLTEKERDILVALHESGAAGMDRQGLLDAVWGYAADVETHTLETHIYRLRQKIEGDPGKPVLLVTEGNGYRLVF